MQSYRDRILSLLRLPVPPLRLDGWVRELRIARVLNRVQPTGMKPIRNRTALSVKSIRGLAGSLWTSGILPRFQKADDRKDRVPVARGRRHAKQLIDLPKVADRLHVAPIHSEHELLL